jgi:hypothetical protein
MSRVRPLVQAMLFTLALAAPASADFTAFLGLSPSPDRHLAKGLAIGGGLVIVGFEFEYCDLDEDAPEGIPGVRTGMGNVLLQTPFPVAGWQFYGTIGGGVYREELAARSETSFAGNVGGGAKVTLAGPLRARFDYRIITLHGDPLYSRVHRFYAGLNLAF